jgi:hypothetical protein
VEIVTCPAQVMLLFSDTEGARRYLNHGKGEHILINELRRKAVREYKTYLT